MEDDNALAIALSFQRTLELLPFETNPLEIDRIQRVLKGTFIPQETKRMRFEIPYPFLEKGININQQPYPTDSNTLIMNLSLKQIITNNISAYSPSLPTRISRKMREKEFLKNPHEGHLEIVCRIARNTPWLQELGKKAQKVGFRYSALGCLEVLYSSEKEGDIWTKMPLLAIPGIYGIDKDKDRPIAEKIFKFGRNYQKPDKEFLESNGYKIQLTKKEYPSPLDM